MAYIGNIPAESYASFERQVFSIVNSQTAYTLSHSVVNENDIRLVVNNVVQEPGSGKAYTASGTSLTLSAALVNGTDEMYCVFLGRALQTVNPPNASVGTAQLASEAVTNAKVASSIITGQTAETSIATDDLILLSDTSASGALKKMTRANFVSGLGLAECSFRAYQNSAQVINNATSSQINLDTEDWDTDNAFASNTFTCPSDKAGKYIVVGAVRADPSWASTDQFNVMIFRNGASNTGGMSSFSIRAGIGNSAVTVQIIDLSAGDTLKLYMYHNEGGSEGLQPGQESTYMAGTRITS